MIFAFPTIYLINLTEYLNVWKKIAIFGSTGSIGKSLIDIIKKDKKDYLITLLTANKNYKELIKQAEYFNVKNLIVTNNFSFNQACKKFTKRFNISNIITI